MRIVVLLLRSVIQAPGYYHHYYYERCGEGMGRGEGSQCDGQRTGRLYRLYDELAVLSYLDSPFCL